MDALRRTLLPFLFALACVCTGRAPAAAQKADSVRVPPLFGLGEEEAREALARSGLRLGAVDRLPFDRPPGTVVLQQPAAGRPALAGSAVSIGVARAPVRQVGMPSLVDLPLAEALGKLQAAGLRPGEVTGDRGSAARVIAHSYAPGEPVALGTEINLSLGLPPGAGQAAAALPPKRVPPAAVRPPPPPRVAPPPARVDSAAVPDVGTLRLAEARAALEGAGFVAAVELRLADSAGWIVAGQEPAAEARVPAGQSVRLVLAPPPPPAAVVPPQAANGFQASGPPAAAEPAPKPAPPVRLPWLWIALGLAAVAAAGAGGRMLRGRASSTAAQAPPTAVRARVRAETAPRVALRGAPFRAGAPRLRIRPAPRGVSVSSLGSPFARKEAHGD